MISLIEALDFRCLRYINQRLDRFLVLVGPNASGKTTFLDVVAFLGQLVSEGLEPALNERTQNFQDLVWQGSRDKFELAIELSIPDELTQLLTRKDYRIIRYEVSIGFAQETGEVQILSEKALLKVTPLRKQRVGFFDIPPTTIMTVNRSKGTKKVITKVSGGNDNFYSETGKGGPLSFKLGPRKSALGNLPEDETKYPVSTWLKRFLTDGVEPITLNSMRMRKASPPGQAIKFLPDGSNLPWIIEMLRSRYKKRFSEWIAHLQTAFTDLVDIRTIERQDDKHRYLVLYYQNAAKIPSWVASDGTLRLLALTLPAYLPQATGVLLIEEPENGIHPRAIETVFKSLSSLYEAQVLVATHSPAVLGVTDTENILCFSRTSEGATKIVLGSEHPALKQWRGETDLGTLFAGGVLG